MSCDGGVVAGAGHGGGVLGVQGADCYAGGCEDGGGEGWFLNSHYGWSSWWCWLG